MGEGKEEPDDINENTQVTVTPLDLLARSKFRWRTERSRMILEAGPGKEIIVEPVGDDLWSVTLREGRSLLPLSDVFLPISYAQGVAEDYVRGHQLESYAARDAVWLTKPVSAAQVELLRREFGVTPPPHMTRGEAQDMIREEFKRRNLTDPNAPWRKEPGSEKQVKWMEARGYLVPPGLTKGDFSDMMDRLKRGRRRA